MTSGDSRDIERDQLTAFWDDVLGELGWCDEYDQDPDTDPSDYARSEIRKMKKKIRSMADELQELRKLRSSYLRCQKAVDEDSEEDECGDICGNMREGEK